MTIPDTLAELRALEERATPGPWKKIEHDGIPSFIQARRLRASDPYDVEILGEDDTLYETRGADLDLIPVSRNTFKATLDLVEAAQALMDEHDEVLREMGMNPSLVDLDGSTAYTLRAALTSWLAAARGETE